MILQCIQSQGAKLSSQNWDHYLPHTSHDWIFDRRVPWQLGSSCSVKVHKIELIFQDDECQQFTSMEKLAFCFW